MPFQNYLPLFSYIDDIQELQPVLEDTFSWAKYHMDHIDLFIRSNVLSMFFTHQCHRGLAKALFVDLGMGK